jgi:hypothetical protein
VLLGRFWVPLTPGAPSSSSVYAAHVCWEPWRRLYILILLRRLCLLLVDAKQTEDGLFAKNVKFVIEDLMSTSD